MQSVLTQAPSSCTFIPSYGWPLTSYMICLVLTFTIFFICLPGLKWLQYKLLAGRNLGFALICLGLQEAFSQVFVEWTTTVPHTPSHYNHFVCMLSCFSHVQLFMTLWTIACQASLSVGFSQQEYWSGLPCPPPGDLSDPGIKLTSP